MQNNQNYLTALCEKICAQGLRPSLALIRGQSTRPLPIPEVIKFLQNWKQDPQKLDLNEPTEQQKTKIKTDLDLHERVAYLESQVAQLQQQLAAVLLQKGLNDKVV